MKKFLFAIALFSTSIGIANTIDNPKREMLNVSIPDGTICCTITSTQGNRTVTARSCVSYVGNNSASAAIAACKNAYLAAQKQLSIGETIQP